MHYGIGDTCHGILSPIKMKRSLAVYKLYAENIHLYIIFCAFLHLTNNGKVYLYFKTYIKRKENIRQTGGG